MRQLDLRTGKPVWPSYRSHRPVEKQLHRDVSTDVLIVGMGISGAMCADILTDAGHQVMVIDRRGASQGSTPASTALVQYDLDVPLTRLRRSIGSEKATRAWRRARLAVDNLHDRIIELGINCRMVPRPALYLAGTELSGASLKKEAEARSDAGLSARYLTASQLKERFRIKRSGAILSHGSLALDPVRLTSGLFAHSLERGARLHAPEEAVAVEHARDKVTVSLASGIEISARFVVLATGYELLGGLNDDRHRVTSTWAIATGQQPRESLWPSEALIWEASDPYLYIRTTHDRRVICGGEDGEFQDETRRDKLLPEKSERIARKLGRLFPSLSVTPHFAWAGSFGATATGLPLIGPVPGKPRVFALMGYGGNGITYSRVAAELIRGCIEGRKDTDRDLFAL